MTAPGPAPQPGGVAVDEGAARWFAAHTSRWTDWPVERLVTDKERAGLRVSVVIPARNEEATVAAVVAGIKRDLVDAQPLVDEVIVIDSLSTDATATKAREAGADVYSVADIVPEHGVHPGKGEALWKSLFVARGDIVVFIDADLTAWGTHFVTGLIGPLVADPNLKLVKGFYDRVLEMDGGPTTQGGRVTELVARPLLTLQWPQLAAVVQPLAGEWAARRDHMASLSIPVGYGVELASLIDTDARDGLDSIAQVDLGRRAHRHQSVHDLSLMAAELLAVASRRWGDTASPPEPGTWIELNQYRRDEVEHWARRRVPVGERAAASTVAGFVQEAVR